MIDARILFHWPGDSTKSFNYTNKESRGESGFTTKKEEMNRFVVIVTMFIYGSLFISGKETDLDSIANHYFNELEKSFFPNRDRKFIEMNVSTEEYPFMDEIVHYLTKTIEEYPTSIYSKEELYDGIFYIRIDYYESDNQRSENEQSDGTEYLYSDDFYVNGSYLIDIWFHPEINVLDNINFSYKGLKFASTQFLLPFFNDITNVSIYSLYDSLSDGFCDWHFLVENGRLVTALYTSEEYPNGKYEGPVSGFYDLITGQPISQEDFRKLNVTGYFPY